jgi:hypothetical protein
MKKCIRRQVFATVLAIAATAHGIGRTSAPPNQPSRASSVQTDKQSYTYQVTPRHITFALRATYINRIDEPVYLAPCGEEGGSPGFSLEKRINGVWYPVYGTVCALGAGVPVEVKPGERYSTRFEVAGNREPNNFPRFRVKRIPGIYRLVLSVEDADYTDIFLETQPVSISKRLRVSNPFQVKAP